MANARHVCVTCGIQFAETDGRPKSRKDTKGAVERSAARYLEAIGA
jgi:hypothetical protein